MSSSPADSYYYLYVIIAKEKTRFLKKSQLINLAKSLDIPTFQQRLVSYFPEISNKIIPDLDSLHQYFRDDQITTNWKIIRNSPHAIFEFLKSLCLIEYEIENIKTIIKSKSMNMDYKEIQKIIHLDVESILKTEDLFNKFIQITNLSDGFELYNKTIYYNALKKGERFYKKYKSLAFYDIFLDHALISHLYDEFLKLKNQDRNLMGEYIQNFINYYNLKTLIRGLNLGFERDFLKIILIFNNSFIERLFQFENVEDLIDYMRTHSKLSIYYKFNKIIAIEELLTHFRDVFHQYCVNLIKKWDEPDVFNILSPVSFLLRKRFEIEDLKLISVGLDYNLPPEDIINKTILCRENIRNK